MNYMTEANTIAAALRGKAKPPGVKAHKPTARNHDVMDFMRAFFAENDQLPPMAHIAAHFGWASTMAAQMHINSLEKHGLIERNACGKYRFSRSDKASVA
jgi:SOS-response transcriptional repressor LexA